MISRLTTAFLGVILCINALSEEFFIKSTGSNGTGSFTSPFTDWKTALLAMAPGDTLTVMPGIYNLSAMVDSRKDGQAGAPMLVRAYDMGNKPLLTRQGPVVRIGHPYHILQGFILDGQFGEDPIVNLKGNAHGSTVRDCIIRNQMGEGVEVRQLNDVLIENCEIYHCLRGTAGDQTDAHGIAAYRARNLTVRGCNIHQVSGDCFQIDPIYQELGDQHWDNILIEDCHLWTGPMNVSAPGYPAGSVPGENAVDTKTYSEDIRPAGYRPTITIRGCDIHGFEESEAFNNRAALNIKHNVNAVVENTKIYDSYIAFRVRGPYDWDGSSWGGAYVEVRNCVGFNNDVTIWFERNIERARFFHCTFDRKPGAEYFDESDGGYVESGFEMLNCAFFDNKPSQAADGSNLAMADEDVLSRNLRQYYPSDSSVLIDAGVWLPGVAEDFDHHPRPMGEGTDIGAFEFNGPLNLPVSGLDVRYGNGDGKVYVIVNSEVQHDAFALRFFNVLGQLVYVRQTETNKVEEFDLSLLTPGVLIVRAGKFGEAKLMNRKCGCL